MLATGITGADVVAASPPTDTVEAEEASEELNGGDWGSAGGL